MVYACDYSNKSHRQFKTRLIGGKNVIVYTIHTLFIDLFCIQTRINEVMGTRP